MRALFATVLLTGIVLFTSSARADETEKTSLPNVLIIGDSISIGYMKPLVKLLEGKANVVHNEGNAAHTSNGLEKLDAWLGDTKWDVIHFNHGLHDLKYVDDNGENVSSKEDGHIQVPVDRYKENLEKIVERLRKTGAKLIFATTTPFPPKTDNPPRDMADCGRYNAAALEVMKRNNVAIDDLYSFALPRLADTQRPNNVHFTKEGSKVLAGEVAKHIEAALSNLVSK